MKKWWIHNNVINTNSLSIAADLRSGTSLTGPTNSLYDKNLQLKFYINNAQIRAANGNLICNLSIGNYTSEYAVVPFIGLDACSEEKYYVFYHFANVISYGLRYQIIQVNKTTGLVSAIGSEVTVFSGSAPLNNSYAPHGAIAVGSEINNKRFLYYLSGRESAGSIQKIDISKSSSTFSGIGNPTTIFNSSSVLYNALELDLSMDGTKLAWGATIETLNYTRAYVVNLNNSGGYTGILKTFNLSNYSSSMPPIIKGVEFNDQGNILFIGLGKNDGPAAQRGILAIDVLSNNITRIPNSENYSTSQIERGADGNMYVGYVTSTNSYLNSFSQNSPYNFNTPITVPLQNKIFSSSHISTQYLVFLPDQLDGENYEVIQNNLTPISYDITSTISVAGTNLWDGNSNPYSKSELNIGASITVPNGATFSLRNLTMNFNSNSQIIVDGGVLIIDAATLQSINCAMMWPGISVYNGGKLYIGFDPLIDEPTYIKDAIRGIDAIGNNRIDVNNARFFANETDIYLNNVATTTTNNTGFEILNPNTLIRNSQFNHTTNLKDQNYGIAMVSNTLAKKGHTGIQVVNTTNPIIIGPNNSFEAGLYGINSISSNIAISGNNTFANIRGSLNSAIPATGIRVVNASTFRKNTTINDNNTFNNCQRGIFAKGSLNLVVSHNNFIGSKETALSVTKNKKEGVIDINHNNFDFCNWEAINLFDNGFPLKDDPNVSTARALLNYHTGEYASDIEEVINDVTGDLHTSCTDSELENIRLNLIDENQDTIAGIMGYINTETRKYHFFGEQLSQLDPNVMISIWANSPDFNIPPHKPLFEWLNSIAGSNAITISCSGEKTKEQSSFTNYYSVFPNPTSDFINIKTNDTKDISFKIYSITGEQVLTGNYQKNPISIGELSSGYYFITLSHIETGILIHKEKLIILNK